MRDRHGIERPSAGDIDGHAIQMHSLSMATELMEDLLDELKVLSITDPSLSRDLMHEGPALSEQLAELRRILAALPGDSNHADVCERAVAILGPVSQRLEALARGFEARQS